MDEIYRKIKDICLVIMLSMGMTLTLTPIANADLLGTRLALTGGTLGVGVDFSLEVLNTFAVRASAQSGSLSHDVSYNGTDYKGDLSLQTLGLQGDFLPFGGGIFASVGAFYNMNKLKLTTETVRQVTQGGNTYNMTITTSSNVSFQEISPYVGGGIRLGILGLVDFSVEGGVMNHGVPMVSTELTQINDAPAGISNTLTIPNDVQNELINNVRTSVEKFTLYPVIKIAGSIKF